MDLLGLLQQQDYFSPIWSLIIIMITLSISLNSFDICYNCQTNFVLTNRSNIISCQPKCEISNCNSCLVPNQCNTCQVGYSGAKCTGVVCTNGRHFDGKSCVCETGFYYWQTNTSCQACSDNCLQCTSPISCIYC